METEAAKPRLSTTPFPIFKYFGISRLQTLIGLFAFGLYFHLSEVWHHDPNRWNDLTMMIVVISFINLIELLCENISFRNKVRRHPLVTADLALVISPGFARVGFKGAGGCLFLTREAWIFYLIPEMRTKGEWVTLFSIPTSQVAKAGTFRRIRGISPPELILSGSSISDVRISMERPELFVKFFEALRSTASADLLTQEE